MTNIFIIEDDDDICSILARGFEAEGFSVGMASRAADALEKVRADQPKAVLLDILLPDGSGHDICRSLREGGYPGTIIFLSARDKIHDRVEGLAVGADDYIIKPFVFAELLARVQAQVQLREDAATQSAVRAGHLSLDLHTRQINFAEISVRLTPREAGLLSLLMENANRPIARAKIFDKVWPDQVGSLNVVDVYIGYLRSKLAEIEKRGGGAIITVRGRGFMLDLKAREPHLS